MTRTYPIWKRSRSNCRGWKRTTNHSVTQAIKQASIRLFVSHCIVLHVYNFGYIFTRSMKTRDQVSDFRGGAVGQQCLCLPQKETNGQNMGIWFERSSLSVGDTNAVAPRLNPTMNHDRLSDDERHGPERLTVMRRLRTPELC